MNQIKEYYRAHFPGLKLEQALRWNKNSMPALYKPWSISYLLAVQIAVMSGLSLGAAVVYFGLLAGYSLWLGALICGFIYVLVQMGLYAWLLRKKQENRIDRFLRVLIGSDYGYAETSSFPRL